MNRFALTIAAAATMLSFAGKVFAGPQYIDNTGYAASGYDVVAYFSLPQNPVGQSQPAPVEGKKSITAQHNGAKFAFCSEANRDAFIADPTKYAPQYDGHCAYGVAVGGKVPANPTLWRVVNGKLYLNITETVEGFWEDDISGNLRKATTNWRSLNRQRASRRSIPQWRSQAPKG